LLLWSCCPTRAMTSSFMRFLDHTQRRTTVGRTPLDEQLAGRRDLYLTTHNSHNSQTSMSPEGFEPTISADERPQTHAVDRAATGISIQYKNSCNIYKISEVEIMSINKARTNQSHPCYLRSTFVQKILRVKGTIRFITNTV
jgi:hypothetical protein